MSEDPSTRCRRPRPYRLTRGLVIFSAAVAALAFWIILL